MSSRRLARLGTLFLAAAFTLFFAVWAWEVIVAGRLQQLDEDVAESWKNAAADDDPLRLLMILCTHLGSVPAMTGLAVGGVLWQLKARRKRLALAWALIVAGGGLLNLALKKGFDRPRPPVAWRDPIVHETNESFPSGHAMGSTIGYGMLAYVVTSKMPHLGMRMLTYLALAVVVALISFSRVYLRAHWLSDVIGGISVGLAWLLCGLAVLSWGRPHETAAATD